MTVPEHRFTITITPITMDDLQSFIDAWRKRFGRKHLIHIIDDQPASTSVHDAPGPAEMTRLRTVEKAAADYVMAGLCGNPSTSAELTALIAAVRTNRDFHG